ncbi:MAG TPA: type II toxin-antitoxin system RelE/ParE family toxin [Thermoanaerobaculia bacterium]|nr:type II toxin-antitoxin system RelE/ParE family toxin [Thermoanaerobaculia bacterium]
MIWFSSEAAEDLRSIRAWYQQPEPALADQFLTAVRLTARIILRHPLAFREVEAGIRQASLPRFPYLLYYQPQDDGIVVLRVLHMRRRPMARRKMGEMA